MYVSISRVLCRQRLNELIPSVTVDSSPNPKKKPAVVVSPVLDRDKGGEACGNTC